METKELWMDEEFCKKVDAASDTEEIIRLFAPCERQRYNQRIH